MNHHEYTSARNRNLLTLLELGIDAGRHYPKLNTSAKQWQYSDQLNAMSEKIDQLRGRFNKRGKQYTYTTR